MTLTKAHIVEALFAENISAAIDIDEWAKIALKSGLPLIFGQNSGPAKVFYH